MTDRAIMWFRRDLRLDDNPAWAAATAHAEVVALFVLEPALLDAASPLRRAQLLANLHALDDELRSRGGALTVRSGPAAHAVPSLVEESGARAVHLNVDCTPFSTERDEATSGRLDVEVHGHHGLTVHEPGSVLTQKGTLSKVFTPFYRTWADTPLTTWPSPGDGEPMALDTEAIPEPGEVALEPGATAAWERLQRWLEHVDDYPDTRDRPDLDGTSGLSVDLKFGTIAARTVLDAVGTSTEGRASFVRQLAWRDWWAHTLTENQDLATHAVRPEYDRIAWRNDTHEFDAWCEGRTGYPIVDAGMRQLVETGWMHNRVRMICASFLVKDLLIDWRWGERFFRHHLIDADVAQNAGNWQWVAGTGPDAAPYFRIFNPTNQAAKLDPDGDYVRRWVPEPDDGYPDPIVDHAEARDATLAAYEAARVPGDNTDDTDG